MKAIHRKSVRHLLYTLLCLVLVFACGFGETIRAIAVEFKPKLYVEEIELYIGESGGDSAKNAKAYFEGKGYVFSGIDLNPGTETERDVWLGYKTTENRDMAITDIRLMAMDTGYQLYDYNEISSYFASQNAGTAQTMYAASIEFADNYYAGSPKAADAYTGLNLFYVDEQEMKLGDYFLSGQAELSFFTKMLTKASTGTLNAVISFLNIGISPYENSYDVDSGQPITENWGALVSQSMIWEGLENGFNTDELNELHKQYNDSARELFKQIQDFTTLYENAAARHPEELESVIESFGDIDTDTTDKTAENMDEITEEDTDILYLGAFRRLNDYYAYSDVKLGDYILIFTGMTSWSDGEARSTSTSAERRTPRRNTSPPSRWALFQDSSIRTQTPSLRTVRRRARITLLTPRRFQWRQQAAPTR